jgi:hypothetical protein
MDALELDLFVFTVADDWSSGVTMEALSFHVAVHKSDITPSIKNPRC